MKNKIYKLLSIVLAVMVVFSCCSVAFTAFAEAADPVPVYYISADGDDTNDGLTPETPVSTVNRAIQLANAAVDEEGNPEYGEGDTVFIKALGTTAIPWGGTAESAYTSLDAYSYKLNISSYTSNAKVGDNTISVKLGGPTDFENIIIWISTYSHYYNLFCNNNDVSFASNVKINDQNVSTIVIGNYGETAIPTEDFTVNFNAPTHNTSANYSLSTVIGNQYGTQTFGGNVTVNYDNPALITNVRVSSSDKKNTFQKNLNINIKAVKSMTFNSPKVAPVFSGDGAFQLINSSGVTLSGIDSTLSVIDDAKKYVLTNATPEYKNALAFTETAGVFDVKEGYSVIAVNANDDSVVVASGAAEGSQDIVLDLREAGAGSYNFTVTKTASTKVVYVSADGSPVGDGSEANPVTTITEAIKLGKAAGLEKVDTLNVKTVGATVDMGVLPVYDFNLHVMSADSATKTSITVNKAVADRSGNTSTSYHDYFIANGVGVLTRYTNVTINNSSDTLSLNGSDLLLDSNVSFAKSFSLVYAQKREGDASATVNHSQKVEIGSASATTVYLSGSGYNSRTYKEDVYLTVNNTSTKTIRFTGGYGPSTYNKNVNINVKTANSALVLSATSNDGSVRSKIPGALQVIDSAGVGFNLSKIASNTKFTAGATWFITNNTDNKEAIDFTSTAGLYKVNLNTEMWVVKATDAEGNVVAEEDGGYLDLTNLTAGEYTVIKERKEGSFSTTYYVSAAGSDTAEGTETSPFATVEGAILKANAEGYGEGDNVYLKVLGTTAVPWHTYSRKYLTSYDYTLHISSATSGAAVGGTTAELNGPTKFSNIKIANSNYIGLGFYGHDVEFASDVTWSTYYVNMQVGVWQAADSPNGYTYNDDINVVYKSSSTRYLNLGNNYSSATFNGNITVTVDNASAAPTFYFSCNNAKATYNGLVNIDFKRMSGLSLTKNSGGSHAFGENAAIQIINSSGKEVTSTTGELANITAPKYIITNSTGDRDLLSFTNTAGLYRINSKINTNLYELKVTNADGAVDAVKDGFIDLTAAGAGEYTITLEKKANAVGTYYVKTEGSDSDDGLSPETAVTTIGKAIDLAKAEGYEAGHKVVIKLIGSTVEPGAYNKYPFDLLVESNDPAVKTTINIGGTIANNRGGTTEYKNVKLARGGSWNYMTMNDANLILGEGVDMSWGYACYIMFGNYNDGGAANTVPGQNITIKASSAPTIVLSNGGWASRTYSEDVNVLIDSTGFGSSITFGINEDATNVKTTFEKNINLVIDNAKSVGFNAKAASTLVFKGAIQVLNSSSLYFNAETAGLASLDATKYIINNTTGRKDIISTTATAGVYTVASDIDTSVYAVKAVSEDGSVTYTAKDGVLTVETPGVYTIEMDRVVSYNTTYYAEAGATDGDGSSEKPFGSLQEAVVAANAAKHTTGDKVTVIVKGTTALPWGGVVNSDHNGNPKIDDFTFDLTVTSEDTSNKGTIGNASNTVMGGNTHFEHIKVTFGSGYHTLSFNGTSSSLGTGATYEGNILMSTFALGSAGSNHTYPNEVNFYMGVSAHYVSFGNRYHNATYNKDVNFVYNSASGQPLFRLGGENASSTVTYKGNVNIDVRNAATFAVIEAGGYTLNNKIQIVNSCGAKLLGTGDSFSISGQTHAVGTSALDDLGDKLYYINNNTGETITFTSVAGVYGISGDETVYAFKNGAKVAESENGTLDLSQLGVGEYTLIKHREATTFNYTNASGDTIAAIISKAISDGAIEGDTVKITLTGTTAIAYGTPAEHLFDVELISTENTPVSFVSHDILKGDTKFDGVKVTYPGGENALWFGGHDVEMTAATTVSGGYTLGFGAKDTNITIDTQTVIIDCPASMYLNFAGDWSSVRREGALNVSLGAAGYAPKIYFGAHGTNTYVGAVNIDLGPTTGVSFIDTGDDTLVMSGGVNIIGENVIKDTAYLDSLDANVYTIYNKTGIADVIDFGESAGKFTVTAGKTVRAMSDTVYVDSVDSVLDLTVAGEGNYAIGIPHNYTGTESTYADYIDYRTALNGNDALNNFAAKVNAGQSVNVVYYGGSVTAGSGASVGDKTSWRGIISSWLEINAPKAKVTNINSAIGGTGSHFGFYRLDEAVLAKNPDLLFIEFSINDYYDNQDQWNIDEDRAAMQIESIVRKVRTKAPECDIVIVLTTDRDQIASLQNSDTLHKQARGHYKIAEKYGIPTLRVGHALADHLATTGEAWADYVTDIVHPNDRGYQIYGGVVKEFMANSLLGDKNKSAVVKDHTVPSNIVSEKIWAGDPVFIPANAALSDESESLGGDKFTVSGGREYPYHTSTFRMDDPNAVLKFKFTGTELSIFEDQYSKHYKGVNVKIDGGTEKYVEFRNYKPTVLASGLENTEHTAEVRIAEVNEGGGHWVYGFFVRNEADDIEKTGMKATYFVNAAATAGGNGLTETTPFATVDEAIAAAVEAGYGPRDEVTVKLIGTTTINWRLVDGALNTATTNYGFKLFVESNDTANLSTAHMAYGTIMGGDVEFNNVKITTVSYYAQTGFWANGHDIIVGDNVTYNPSDFALGYSSNSGSFAGQNIVFKSKITTARFYLGNNSHFNSRRYTEDVNITIDNAGSAPNISTNVGYGPGTTYYNKNLNLNVQDAAAIKVVANNGKGSLSIAGGLQVYLNNPNTAFTDENKANLAGCVAEGNKIYYITNNSGIDNVVEFVPGETGKLKVNVDTSRYTVYVNGEEATVTGGRIDLGAEGGDFSITVTKAVETLTYYVSATGSDETGDGSLGAPYATVLKAAEVANEKGLLSTDSVVVNVIGTAAVQYGMTSVTHKYPITIQSVDPESKGTIYFGRSAADNGTDKGTEKFSAGDLVFNNIIVTDRTGGSTFHANGYNITMGAGTVMNPGTFELSEQEKTHTDEQTIIVNNAYTGTIHTSNGNYSNVHYNEDVNIIIDNASANPTIGGTAYWGGGVTSFKKNLNVIVKQAAGLKFGANAKSDGNGTMSTVVNGAINLLVPSNITLSDDSRANLAKLTTNVYEVVNALGNAGTIEFVKGTTGQYTVSVDSKYNGYVTDDEGVATLIEGTDLVFDAAGKYIVSATRKSNNVTYYAQAGGTGDGSSAESPLGTVKDVIEKAIAEDWNYDSFTVKVMVVGTEALPWGVASEGVLPAHKFNLVIDSEVEGAMVGSSTTVYMGGDVEFSNVKLIMSGTSNKYPSLALNGHNAVFNSTVTSDGVYWTLVAGKHRDTFNRTEAQYITIDAPFRNISLSNSMSGGRHTAPLYVTYNNKNNSPAFSFGTQYGTATYNSNVMIDIKAAAGASFSTTAYQGGSSFGETAKVQIINRTGLAINSETAGLSTFADKLWVITDTLGELGTLTASAEVGAFTVEYDDVLYAVKAVGANTYEADGTTLNIPVAGTYTVAAARRQVADVLYVSASGAAVALGTKESPFDTVASAVAAAKDSGYGKGDLLTIKVMGDTVDMGNLPTYEFDLSVLSEDANVKTQITLTGSVILANGEGAHTHFSNVTIVRSNQYSSIQLRDSNVTFESDVTFTVGYGTVLVFGSSNDGGASNTIAGQTVIINSNAPLIHTSNWSWSGRTNTEDVNVVLNNPAINTEITLNATDSGSVNGTTFFEKNLNFNIKDAANVTFAYGSGVGVTGGFQIINSTDIVITAADAGIADVTGAKWIITNKMGADDVVFTETAGTFNIANFDSATHYLVVTDANGDETEYNVSTITLPAGEYTIEKVRHPRTASYTLSADSAEGLVSIEAAILAANAAGYGEGDTVIFNISGETAVPFATTLTSPARLTAFEYQLIIQTAEGEDRRTVGGEKKAVNLSGDVEFKNVVLDTNGTISSYPTFGLGGNNVKINSDCSFNGVYWGFVSGYNANSLTAREDVNIYLGVPVTADSQIFKIGNSYTGNYYYGDVNVTHNANSAIKFAIGTRSNELTHFKKNLNFNIMKATYVSFTNAGADFAVGSEIQIINSTANEITASTSGIADLKDLEGNALPKYIITNKTGMPEALSFTKTAGVYKVDMGDYDTSRYYLIATDADGKTYKSVGDTLTVPTAGEYTVTVGKPAEGAEFLVEEGTQYATLADAITAANEAGFLAGDDVVIKVSGTSVNAGSVPKYGFNLVVKSYDPDNKTTINVASSMLANNEGGTTDYKNVNIYFTSTDSYVGLGGANVTFDKNVVISGGWNNTIAFGSNNDGGKATTIEGGQKLVLNGQFLTTTGTKTFINLSNTGWADRTYEGDVELVVDNSKAAPVIAFNAYYGGNANGTTAYRRNLNLNIRNAKSVAFTNKNGGNVSGNSYVQLITNANTTISDEDLEWLKGDYTYGYFYHLIDKSFQRDFLETTSEAGLFKVNTDLVVTATQVDFWDEDGNVDTSVDNVVVSKDGYLDLRDIENEGLGTWEITTSEYFEDFDNFDYEDLATDWTSNHAGYDGKCEITEDGKLLVESLNGVPNKSCIVMSRNIKSLTQYVSLDIDPDGYKSYDAGAVIYARASSNHKSYYSLALVNGIVRVNKYLGQTNAAGNYVATSEGWDTTGLNKRLPHSSKNMVTFNDTHNYRMGMSIVDKNGSAYVRAFVLDLNANEFIFDETFKDDQPLTNTGIGFSVEGSGVTTSKDYCNTYFDNFYFSTEGFRVGDEGQIAGDINRDGVHDLRDLVYASEAVTDTKLEITLSVADKDQSGVIDDGDLPVIRKELLTGIQTMEFDYKGYADAQADALREQILGSTSTLNGKVYTAYNNGEAVLTHNITGNIWYVSETGAGKHNGTSPENAWTLAELNANADTGAAGPSVDNKTIKSGDAVLFERGSEFRLVDNLVRDEAVDGQVGDYYGYLVGQQGVLYGAYGTGAKPKFIDSAKNYATANWTQVAGKENLWVVDAPEIIIDNGTTKDGGSNGKKATDNGATNIIFNNGAKIGHRRAFTYANNLYTLYKDGQFTYDESTGKLYLYSLVDPKTYTSIEVSRGISGMMWNASENNIVVDNLAFQGFAGGALGGIYGTHTVTVTNCDIGYSGGMQRVDEEEQTSLRWGNAVGIWCGGKNFKVNHNWIYQTFDTAISPQGNTAVSYDGFQIIGNLLEYNNCDIEVFDRGTASGVAESKSATWNSVKWTDNIMRFTTLGWGSRHVDQIRGIQGVIRGSLNDASVVAIDWTNNIIDTPGMEVVKLDNTTDYEVDSTDSEKDIPKAIFKFGTSYTEGTTADTSLLGNNKYYLNPYVRVSSFIATDYMTMLPSEYEAQYGTTEKTNRYALTASQFYESMSAIDTATTSQFYWLGKKIS